MEDVGGVLSTVVGRRYDRHPSANLRLRGGVPLSNPPSKQ